MNALLDERFIEIHQQPQPFVCQFEVCQKDLHVNRVQVLNCFYFHDDFIFDQYIHAEAEFQLGMSYCCGFGPGHTNTIAYKWLCRAALQGHEKAQFQLGRMLGNGIKKRPFSTPQHADFAYMWYGLAAAQGDQMAAGYMYALEETMLPQEIIRARDWETHPETVVNCGKFDLL